MDDLITVIMPCYHSELYIRKSIESILAQTYKNWELIIVDDYSIIDNSLEIINEYCKKDKRIQLIKNKMNYGTYYSLNEALKISKGTYITKLDSDDVYFPTKLENQLQFCKENNIEGCTCNIIQQKKQNNKIFYNSISNVSSLMFSRNIFNKIGYYDNARFDCDSEYLYRVSQYFNIKHLDKNLYCAIYRKNSLTTSYNTGCDLITFGNKIRKTYKNMYTKNPFNYISHPTYIRKNDIHIYQKSPIECSFLGEYTIISQNENITFYTKLGCCIEVYYKCILNYLYKIDNIDNYTIFLSYINKHISLDYTKKGNQYSFIATHEYIKIQIHFKKNKTYTYKPIIVRLFNVFILNG